MWSRFPRRLDWLLVGTVLGVHVGLLAWNAWRQSPTVDEPAHLIAGISYWKTGRFDLYNVNPPLPSLIGAVPVLIMGPSLEGIEFPERPSGRMEFALGWTFIEANAARIFPMMTAARCACVVFSLIGAVVCYRWALALWGRGAGLLALALWCFSPEVLAHGSLMTPDLPAAATGIWAGYVFWKWIRDRTGRNALVAGLVLGIALLSKSTWIILFPLWPLMWGAVRFARRRADPGGGLWKDAGLLAGALTLALAVVNAGYLFQGSFKSIGEYDFVSEVLTGVRRELPTAGNRFRETRLAEVPVPLPAPFVTGLDLQKWDFENFRPAYLCGRYYSGGCWYFYLYAALVKWPLGFWLLLWFSCLVRARADLEDALPLLVPPLVMLGLVSAAGTPGYFRYLLPALPFLFVWCGRVATTFDANSLIRGIPGLAAAVWLIASSLCVYPHSLSYFNEFAGGPENGHVHLIDCNIDWGQDLLELRDWLARHPQDGPVYLAYTGPVNPRVAGIDLPLPPVPEESSGEDGLSAFPPGVYIVSVHLMRGGLGHVSDEQGRFSRSTFPELRHFLEAEPVARVGFSMDVFRIDRGRSASSPHLPIDR